MDLVATVVIAAVGLAVAFVTFGVLRSSTKGNVGGYEVGGAIAGFLVTTATLGSFYLQQRKASGELSSLRAKNLELAQKLIRSVPRPEDWEIEIDERQRVVLARPRQWHPRGGVIFTFQDVAQARTAGQEDVDSYDVYPATFALSYDSIDPSTMTANAIKDRDEFYAHQRALAEDAVTNGWIARPNHEYIHLGDDAAPLKCLKTVTCSYYTVSVVPDPVTGRVEPSFTQIDARDYEDRKNRQEAGYAEPAAAVKQALTTPGDNGGESAVVGAAAAAVQTAPSREPAAGPQPGAGNGATPSPPAQRLLVLQRMLITCYHRTLEKVFYFDLNDDDAGFAESSGVMDRMLRSTRFLA